MRSHWATENSLHWVLDVTLNEDAQRSRTGHGARNLAALRRLALNVARAQPDKRLPARQDQARRMVRRLPFDMVRAAQRVK